MIVTINTKTSNFQVFLTRENIPLTYIVFGAEIGYEVYFK